MRIHSQSVKRKYTTIDIVIDGEGTPTVVGKIFFGPIYYAGDTAAIPDPYRKERDNYLNDKEYQQQILLLVGSDIISFSWSSI